MSEITQIKSKNHTKTRTLCECAIMLALSVALSFFSISPGGFGGSITPASMLPVMVIGIRHGYKWGLGTSFVFSLFQLITGISYFSYVKGFLPFTICLFFDFLIPFTLLGLTAMAVSRKKGSTPKLNVPRVISVSFAVMLLRFLCHFFSGVTIWREYAGEQNPIIYSLVYNVVYMLPEMAITLLVLGLMLISKKIRALLIEF